MGNLEREIVEFVRNLIRKKYGKARFITPFEGVLISSFRHKGELVIVGVDVLPTRIKLFVLYPFICRAGVFEEPIYYPDLIEKDLPYAVNIIPELGKKSPPGFLGTIRYMVYHMVRVPPVLYEEDWASAILCWLTYFNSR